MLYLLIALMVVVVLAWLRLVRRARQRWLARLALPGIWLQDDKGARLQMGGSADHGDLVWVEDNQQRQGHWRVQGDALVCDFGEHNEQRYQLRLLQPGRIGLSDAVGEVRVFDKQSSNVVALPLRGK